ncbi:hypothetical protein Q9966_011813 [Columba livia]|nr:hypothetical protein Q9966_011813 [Columba livia]
MMPAVGVHQLTSCCGTLYCFAWVLFQDDAEAITGTEHISVSTQARTTDVRYLSLPQGPRQPTRQKTRHVTFTDHCRSGSDADCPVMFRPQPRLRPLEAKHYREELIPMAHLNRRPGSSNLSSRRGNSIRQHHFNRAENLALMPKSRFTVGEVEGYESEEETETMAPARPLDI